MARPRIERRLSLKKASLLVECGAQCRLENSSSRAWACFPVVWRNRIFLTTDIEGEVIPDAAPVKHKIEGQPFRHPDSVGGTHKHTLKVMCFDVETGKQLWDRTAYEGAVYDDIHKFNTYASPTPVTDGKYVYAYFESQGLYKYDFEGKLIWKMSLGGIASLGVETQEFRRFYSRTRF